MRGLSPRPAALVSLARAAISAIVRGPLARQGLWIVAGHAVTAIAGIASIRLFTQLAPQSVFGGANLLLGFLTLGMQALIAPLTQTQVRYQTYHTDKGDGDRFTWLIARFAMGSALAIIVTMCAALLVWPSARVGAGVAATGWLAVWIALSTARGVLISRLNAERQQRHYALWTGSEAVLLLVCTASVLAFWPTIEGYIAGQVLGVAGAILVFGTPQIKAAMRGAETDRSFQNTVQDEIKRYGLPFVGFAVLGWLSNLSDRYVLAAYLDTAAVGQYIAAFAIASRMPALAGGLLTDLLRPVLFEFENRSDSVNGGRLFLVWIALLGAIIGTLVIFLALYGDLVARVLLAESYRANAPRIMSWIAAGYGLANLGQVVENRVLSFGASRLLLWSKLAGGASNFAFAVLLISMNGLIGAAQANTIGHAMQLLLTILILQFIQHRMVTAHR